MKSLCENVYSSFIHFFWPIIGYKPNFLQLVDGWTRCCASAQQTTPREGQGMTDGACSALGASRRHSGGERSQAQKAAHCTNPLKTYPEKGKIVGGGKRSVVARSWGWQLESATGEPQKLGGTVEMFRIVIMVVIAWLDVFVKAHWIRH